MYVPLIFEPAEVFLPGFPLFTTRSDFSLGLDQAICNLLVRDYDPVKKTNNNPGTHIAFL